MNRSLSLRGAVHRSLPFLVAGLVFVGCGGSVDSSAFTEDVGSGTDTGSAGGDGSTTDTGGGGGDSTAGDSSTGDTGTAVDSGPGSDTATDPDTGILPVDTGILPVDTGTVTDTSTVSCSDLSGKPYNGHCYFVLKVRTFAENTAVCNSYGGYLTAITSDGEQYFVQGLYPGADAWIGLQRVSGGKFDKWTDGEAVGYTHWASGEPNGSGYCGRMLGGGGAAGYWGDNPCDYTYNAICERNYL